MVDLKIECSRLRDLGRSKPTGQNLRVLLDAMDSKFESIQVTAGKVLGRWGGREAAAALKDWLLRSCQKPRSHSIQIQAAKALAPWLETRDAEWAVELYFSRPKSSDAHFLLPLISALPWTAWRSKVAEEAKSRSVVRRRAAVLAVAQNAFPGRRQILELMQDDSEPEIRSLARWHLARERAAV